MRTLYIDVYFLINFALDLISVYFASIISQIPTTQKRLLFSAFLGSCFAVLTVIFSSFLWVGILGLFLYVFSLVVILTKGVVPYRKIKFLSAFFIVEFLLGGFVQFLYGVLDKYLLPIVGDFKENVGNRRLILLALIVLLSVAVLRILSMLFSSRLCGGAVTLDISFEGRSIRLDAFCDSGNLVKDPLDFSPVVIVKKSAIEPLFPEKNSAFFSCDGVAASKDDYELKKKMRLIPVKKSGRTDMMVGIKPDSISIVRKKNGEKVRIRATVAIDNEGGTYGGYHGLIPAAAISDALV